VNSYFITLPTTYNNSPTAGPGCLLDRGSLSCPSGILLGYSDTGSAELDTSKVFAWDREVNIVFLLPPAELFWSDVNFLNPDIPLSHVIVDNQESESG